MLAPTLFHPARAAPGITLERVSTTPLRVTVGVLTFHRPEHIGAAIRAIGEQIDELRDPGVAVEILVVDNDPAGSAQTVCTEVGRSDTRYVIEPRPGIAAGRNRVLTECADRDLILFMDDDGRPGTRWLARMIACWRAYSRPAGVAGWVATEYVGAPDPWLLAGGFFDRRKRRTGELVPAAACGNLLLDLRVLRRHNLRFPDDTALTGGEDTTLTSRLVAAGEKIVFCAEAEVLDLVAVERLTRGWVLQRALSHGNTNGHLDVELSSLPRPVARLTVIGGGMARTATGFGGALVGVLTRSTRREATELRRAFRGMGMVAAGAGFRYAEYARDRRGLRRFTRSGARR